MLNLKDIGTVVGHEVPPSEAGETRPLPEAKTPALIRTMTTTAMMMVQRRRRRGGEGTLFVPLKVRDTFRKKKKKAPHPLKRTDRKTEQLGSEGMMSQQERWWTFIFLK